MKKEMLAVFALISVLLISGCTSQNQSSTKNNISILSTNESSVYKVEVLHFHGTHQCYSCITVGKYAEETVITYFPEEVKSGKIVFAHINSELPENSEMVTKYGAAGSSLWIGVYDENGFHKEENVNVWYKINNKVEYVNYLKDIIERRLRGEME